MHLAAATLVLGLGLGLIYLPILRRPAVLFAGAISILFAGAAFPEWVLMVGPALAIGAALALLASLLYLLVPRRVFVESSPTPSTVHALHASSREGFFTAPLGGVSSNAPTIALRTSESKA